MSRPACFLKSLCSDEGQLALVVPVVAASPARSFLDEPSRGDRSAPSGLQSRAASHGSDVDGEQPGLLLEKQAAASHANAAGAAGEGEASPGRQSPGLEEPRGVADGRPVRVHTSSSSLEALPEGAEARPGGDVQSEPCDKGAAARGTRSSSRASSSRKQRLVAPSFVEGCCSSAELLHPDLPAQLEVIRALLLKNGRSSREGRGGDRNADGGALHVQGVIDGETVGAAAGGERRAQVAGPAEEKEECGDGGLVEGDWFVTRLVYGRSRITFMDGLGAGFRGDAVCAALRRRGYG